VVLALVVTASLALGCRTKDKTNGEGSADDDTATIQDGSETAAAETDAQLVTSSLLAASTGSSLSLESTDLSGGDLGTQSFGDAARAVYFPRGCLDVKTPDATGTAVYTFARCIGPNGLRAVSGTVKARATRDDQSLRLDLTATDLSVNKAALDWAASAIVRVTDDGTRTMTWSAQLSGTTARGRRFTRTNDYTIAWKPGEACFALDGKATGEVDGREVRTSIEGFRRCRRGCPDSGKSRTFELTYDGSNEATFTRPNGTTSSIPLLCAQ
jgi:hypothetical protein